MDSRRLSLEFSRKREERQELLASMSNSTQSFLSEANKQRFLGLQRTVRKKEEFDHLKENRMLTVLVKLPKKLEDIAELNRVRKEFEVGSRVPNKEAVLAKLNRLTQTLNAKYFGSCLLRSLASVNGNNYRQKAQSLKDIWNELTETDLPNRQDILFGLLWYKLNSPSAQTEGSKGFKERLEAQINLSQNCANFLVLLQGDQTDQGYTAMSSELLRSVEEKQSFLVERLLERGQFFTSVHSIFLDESAVELLKLKHYLANLGKIVDAVKNLLFTTVNEHNPALLEDLAGWMKGRQALHPLFHRLNGLISLFRASYAKGLQTLLTETSRGKLAADVRDLLAAQLGGVKYQRLKLMVEDSELIKKFID